MDIELNLSTETVQHANPVLPLCVEPATTIRDVFACMIEQNYGSVLICRDAKLLGIFTERDALRLMAEGGDLDRPIEQVMVSKPVTLDADDTVATAIQKMSVGGYRRMPVVDGKGKPVALVKVSGIVHYLVEHFPKSVYNLPPVSGTPIQQREGP